MPRIMALRSTTDRVYDSGPIRLWYNIILYYNTYHCVTFAYIIQYRNMLYKFWRFADRASQYIYLSN